MRRDGVGSWGAGREARSVAVALIWFFARLTLDACPICFQMEQGPVTRGMRAAVIVLVAVTASVLTGFAAFIVRFSRRARQ